MAGVLQEAVAAFVKWVYEDVLDPRMDAQAAVALLRVANFFGAPHLVSYDLALCVLAGARKNDCIAGPLQFHQLLSSIVCRPWREAHLDLLPAVIIWMKRGDCSRSIATKSVPWAPTNSVTAELLS